MDQEQSIAAQKSALVQQLETARRDVTMAKSLVTEKIASPVRTMQKVKEGPLPLLIGSGFLAFGSISILKRLIPRRSTHKKHGLIKNLILSSAFSLAKPYLKVWATSKVTEFITKKHRS